MTNYCDAYVQDLISLIDSNKLVSLGLYDDALMSSDKKNQRKIEKIKNVHKVMKSVANNTSIKNFDFSYLHLTDSELHLIAHTLEGKENVEKLSFRHNRELEDWGALFSVLPTLKGLKHLDLSLCKISDEDGKNLVKALADLPKLETLDLSGNVFEDGFSKSFSNYLKTAKGLKKLNLSEMDFEDEYVDILSEGLRKAPSLTTLSLSDSLTDYVSLLHAVKENKNIIKVSTRDLCRCADFAAERNKSNLTKITAKVLAEGKAGKEELAYLSKTKAATEEILKENFGYDKEQIKDFENKYFKEASLVLTRAQNERD